MCKTIAKMSLMVLWLLVGLCMMAYAADSSSELGDRNVVDRLGVEGPLTFDGTLFSIAWTANPDNHTFAQEYLPDGENLERFNQMLTIHLFLLDTTPYAAVMQHAARLDSRRKTVDPVTNFMISKSPDSEEYILDCIVGEIIDNEVDFVEFSIYRYTQIRLDNGKKALLVYTYSKRSYGDDIYAFFETFSEDRLKYISHMTSVEMPAVNLIN